MKYSQDEIMQYVREEDVKFIRLAFCDVFGKQKNIAIMPQELDRAFEYGLSFDASSVAGFGDEVKSDLMLHPEADTLMVLPWRPEHGRVVRMFADVTYPDGTPCPSDCRQLLKNAVSDAEQAGYTFSFGAEQEFYLFRLDENGNRTLIPYDEAGYMDVAPEDRGENIRREICLTLERMGIQPESSHHEGGPGQNEIDFRYSDALTAADNAVTFRTIVRTVAQRNGLYADFSAKPLQDKPGNGFHINISVQPDEDTANLNRVIAGILEKIEESTLILNPTEDSYKRFGQNKAPRYISWSRENRSQLVRIPAAEGIFRRAELRSPDPGANPYLAYTLMIRAGLYGLENKLELPEPANINLYTADASVLAQYRRLPGSLGEARLHAANSNFIRTCVPRPVLEAYL